MQFQFDLAPGNNHVVMMQDVIWPQCDCSGSFHRWSGASVQQSEKHAGLSQRQSGGAKEVELWFWRFDDLTVYLWFCHKLRAECLAFFQTCGCLCLWCFSRRTTSSRPFWNGRRACRADHVMPNRSLLWPGRSIFYHVALWLQSCQCPSSLGWQGQASTVWCTWYHMLIRVHNARVITPSCLVLGASV